MLCKSVVLIAYKLLKRKNETKIEGDVKNVW